MITLELNPRFCGKNKGSHITELNRLKYGGTTEQAASRLDQRRMSLQLPTWLSLASANVLHNTGQGSPAILVKLSDVRPHGSKIIYPSRYSCFVSSCRSPSAAIFVSRFDCAITVLFISFSRLST